MTNFYNRFLKRQLDIVLSVLGLVVLLPLILLGFILVWCDDRQNPVYKAPRIGKSGRVFSMYKIRTMIPNADKLFIDSTSSNDIRITTIGKWLRRFKIDELPQLFNVIRGEMSLVGPRPNVERETMLYTETEQKLLSVLPGVSDFSSIVFYDLGEILKNSEDPNLTYRLYVRPWKSRLGLLYINHTSLSLDLKIITYTLLSFFSHRIALLKLRHILVSLNVDEDLIEITKKSKPLIQGIPP